jgi:hypothetical protein
MIKRIMMSLFLLVLIALPTLATEANYQPAVSGISNPPSTQLSIGKAASPSMQNLPAASSALASTCHFGLALIAP